MQTFRNAIAVAALAIVVPPLAAGCSTTQPVSSSTDDAGTTARVKSRLAASPQVSSLRLDVDTETGVVFLHGRVETEEQRQAAEMIASQTKGVRQVINQITLKSELPPDGRWDKWITTKVKSALVTDLEVRAMNVDVDTKEGVVFLTGIVKEERDREKIIELAKGIQGVNQVVDNMVLEDEAWEMPREGGEVEIEAQGPEGEQPPTLEEEAREAEREMEEMKGGEAAERKGRG